MPPHFPGAPMATITDALPPPKKCDNCQSKRVRHYKDTKHDNRAMYVCLECKSSVYCHEGTRVPLGYMADAETRLLRIKAHEEFDRLWQHKLITRDAAYDWLARQLGIPDSAAHIGRLDKRQLAATIRKAGRYYRKIVAQEAKRKALENATNRRQRTVARRKRGGKYKPTPK
jgi:hypothetical protein